MSYDVHVVRSADWLQAASDPISRADVDTVVAADSESAWSETDAVEMADETGTVTRYFMITWRGASCFWWYQNQVVCSNPAPPECEPHTAESFGARFRAACA